MLIIDRGEMTGRDEDESGTLRSVVDGLYAHGGRPALMTVRDEGVEICTNGELAGRVRVLGRGLQGAGVERGDHVALLAANSREWVAACLAVISAGAVVVLLDAQIGDEALSHVLEDSGARHVFTTADQAGRLESVDAGAGLRTILLDVGEDDRRSWRCLQTDEDVDLPPAGPDDVAALFYTSGTTGAAKGVPLSHANLAFQIDTLLGADLVSEEHSVLGYLYVTGRVSILIVTPGGKNVQPEAVEAAYLRRSRSPSANPSIPAPFTRLPDPRSRSSRPCASVWRY